jgi:hypothetical protein
MYPQKVTSPRNDRPHKLSRMAFDAIRPKCELDCLLARLVFSSDFTTLLTIFKVRKGQRGECNISALRWLENCRDAYRKP